MPSPSQYHQPPVTNAWQESNKTLEEDRNAWSSPSPQPAAVQQQQSAYQYTGTAYGNTNTSGSAYSPNPPAIDTASKIEAPMTVSDNEAIYNNHHGTSKFTTIRFFIRIALFVAAVGHLGFAAGASPFSGDEVPFENKACFYYLFAVVS
ncbi:hypothetical protein BD770DRAFT_326659 [Pilaira anomala]|nr:hypothetical protein BD770DRAFT_326659 [Pilaira anomala]